MANYATLKAAIQQVVKTNGDNEITGALLQQSLLSMINSLGVGYQFVGIATPTTNPGTPDQKVFYIAIIPGAYSNFSGIIIDSNEIAILTYSGQWGKIAIPVVNQRAIDVIYNELLFYDSDNLTPYFYDLTGDKAIKYDGIASRFRSIIIPCEKNDSFLIKTVGGANGRAWGIVDESLNILACADANANLLSGYTLNITQDNAAYLIVNDNINIPHAKELFAVEKNGAIIQKVNKNTKDVTNISDNINNLYDVFYDTKMGEDTIFGYIDVTYEKFWNNIRIVADKAMIFNNDRLKSITIKSFGSANSQASIAYIYDENDILVQSFELGIVGTENTTFDLVDKNIILRPGYSVAVKGISYANFNSTNRFYDYDSNSYITTYCYGISITVERNTASQRINLNSKNIASIISSYPTELVPNYPSAQTNVTGRFTPWLGFSKVKDLDKDGFLKAVVFSGTLSFSYRFSARVSRKVRNAQGVIQSLTTIREFSFYLEANKNRAELSELMPFGKDCVLEVLYDFNIPEGFAKYRASAATGEWIKFQDQAVVSGSMWDVNAEIVYFGQSTGASAVKKSIKILSVGNSFAEDAFAYVPFILKDCCPSIDLTFGILYYGGCSLQLHEQHFDTSGDTSYAYRKILPEETKWSTKSSGCSIQYALGDDDWDVIVFQQNGSNAGTYSTFQPYLNSLIRKFKSILNKPVRFAWHLIEPYDRNLAESVTRFESYCVTAEKVLNETLCDILFPSGTGLQNARTIASLQSLGDGGNMMHTSQHAQEGIPCYALALPNALVIADLCGFGASGIYGDTNVPTQTWVTERAIPNQNGTSVGATSANCHLAQMAAIMAHKKPLQITNLTELGIIG